MPDPLLSATEQREAPSGIACEFGQVRPALWALLSDAVQRGRWPIYLHGAAGRGKTCAMAALYQRWDRGRPGWLRLSAFLDVIAACRRSGSVTIPGATHPVGETHLWRVRVEQPALLCVDDVGIMAPTPAQFGMIYELVDRRGTLPVIYTSNLHPADLQKVYDGRIASRMLRGIDIELTGNDRRLEGAVSVRA